MDQGVFEPGKESKVTSSSMPPSFLKNLQSGLTLPLPNSIRISKSLNPSLDTHNINQNASNKPQQFRQLYEELEPDYYEEEAIIMKINPDRDGRQQVEDTTIYPFSAHGRLIMMFNGCALYGSGTLINTRYVLTAAHNLYSHRMNREPDFILFIPGLNGTNCPYGKIGVRRYFYPEEYKHGKSEDYGLLELDEDIGSSTGFIEMRNNILDEIDNIECSIYGYPAYINRVLNDLLYGMRGRVSITEDKKCVRYQIDTDVGQSGSSIYYHSTQDDKHFTIGVHVRGYLKLGYNEGTFLTTERIDRIQEWIDTKVLPTKHNLFSLIAEVYGRDSEISRLRDCMRYNREFGVMCLYGIAGVGKTTIALKFALQAIGKYDYIWWIDSANEDTFKSYVLGLADILRVEGTSYEEKLKNLRKYINSTTTRFLFILDNLEDEIIARNFLTTRGHFIVTTRLEQLEFEKINVGTLSSEASVKLLSSRLPSRPHKELECLANFLENLPLALLQSAAYIRRCEIDIKDYIEEFSKIINRDAKLKQIVSKNIDSLSEESQFILKIACLGYCDNIPYDLLYNVFTSAYSMATQDDFNNHLGEIIKLSILSYDSRKELFKIHRVLHESYTLKLSSCMNDELIQHYSNYLYDNYNSQIQDIYKIEEVDRIKYLTLHAAVFLNKYRANNISSKDVLLYSKIALAYNKFLLDYSNSNNYILITEKLMKEKLEDSELPQNYTEESSSIELYIHNNLLAPTYYILGLLYYSLGNYKRSEEYYLKCIQIIETLLPEDHPYIAANYNSLGLLYFDMGDYKKSEEYSMKSLKLCETFHPENRADIAQNYNNLGILFLRIGEYSRSVEYLLKCMQIKETILDENHPSLAVIYNNLGSLYSSLGQYSRSEEYYLKGLKIFQAILPEDHPDLASAYSSIGLLYESMGEYKRSEEFHLKSLNIRENVLPTTHPDLAKAYNSLGSLYCTLGEYERSEYYVLKCLNIQELILNEEHPDLAKSYNDLGVLYSSMGDYNKSEEYHLKSLKIEQTVYTATHPSIAKTYINLGSLYFNIGDYKRSEEFFLKGLEIQEVVLNQDNPDTADTYNNLGTLYFCMGEYTKSEDYFLKSLKMRENILPENHPDIAIGYNNLGLLYFSLGDYKISEEYHLKCMQIREIILPEHHPNLAATYNDLGSLYNSIGDYKRSEEFYLKYLKILESVLPEIHPNLCATYGNLGGLYNSMEDYTKSEEYLMKYMQIQEAVLPQDHSDLADTYRSLAFLLFGMGESKRSEEYYLKSIKIQENILDENHPDLVTSYLNVANIYKSIEDYQRSEEYYLKGIKIQETILDENHTDLVTSYINVADVYKSMKDYQRSEEYYLKAIKIQQTILPEDHSDLAETHKLLENLQSNKSLLHLETPIEPASNIANMKDLARSNHTSEISHGHYLNSKPTSDNISTKAKRESSGLRACKCNIF